ncbi:MAG TPA: cupin domain-containing protein [Pyrinomonadaceae bacterium]|nr:cupin domain-containing protein [Pyrinomonadaceae bacterium]
MNIQRWNEANPPVTSELRKRLEDEGYVVTENSDAPGAVYEPHTHDKDQTHWILTGEVEFNTAGETYRLRAGDRDFLPANTEHAAFVVGSETVRYLTGVKE